MLIKETWWEKLDGRPLGDLVLVTSDFGSDGTFEDIFWNNTNREVYRKRSWGASHRTGPAGEIWFIFIQRN